jgi:hypothetical protein
MRLIKMFLFILPSVWFQDAFATVAARNSVLVCYGKLDPETIKGYSYVILEAQHYNIYELRKIKSQNEKVLAYISLGEVNGNAVHYDLLKNNTLGKNEIWDSYYINLKSEKTIDILMGIISEKLEMGYDGFFLDNIDNFNSFGTQPDQKPELLTLMRKIHETWPKHTFLQNAGLEMVSETAPYVDAIIIESIASDYTFNDKNYKLRDEQGFQNYVEKLKAIKKDYHLPVILIEYADTVALRDAIEKRIKPLGFDYFIGNISLQTIPEFTK